MSPRRPRLVGINHIALEVGDLDRALDFYGGIFELELRGRLPHMAFVDIGDQFVALAEGRTQPPDEGRHFGLVVDDKDAVRAALTEAGAEILPGRGLDFRDPWGNHVQVVEYGDIQFTKAPHVLRGMGLEDLEKSPEALRGAEREGSPVAMIRRSPDPEVEIPDVDVTSHVLEHARERGDKPALIDGPSGRELTYAELADAVRGLAAGLAARGFGRGDVLGVYMPNLPEYALAFHGAASAGGACTTVNPLYTPEELAYQLKDAGARILLTVPPFLDAATAAAASSGVEEVAVVGEAHGATPFADLLGDAADAPEVEIDPRTELAVLPYSSGTTGLPKGVMLTHRNLVANLCQVQASFPIGPEDTLIGVLPFFHIYGMTVIMNQGLRGGATIITMPRFDLEQFCELIERHAVTRAYVVPPIALALAKHPVVDERDLSALRTIMSGAAPLGGELAEQVAGRVGTDVIQGYGLTETSPVTHLIRPDRENRPGSIGEPLCGTECRIVDPESGEDVGEGVRGELWIRGPQVMRGYLNNTEATEATLDSDGWLHTGDIATADADGYFQIVDRLKELIKYKGFQVAPAELEALIVTHPAVQDVAVVGVPDEEAGELPKAYVVPAEGELDADELMAFVAERVAPQKRIRLVETIEGIPKSPSGKILRRVLVEREREARAAS
jgi:acyl-CoA synthetase (AMP-forming)/AMP-acid ligase II/catechol 2,3-dioxygenase-like lactoylglutathione lyase family enzyme